MTRKPSEELAADLATLVKLEMLVSGNESLFGDIFASVGTSLLNGAKIAGGAAADGVVAVFRKANRSLALSYGSHKTQFQLINNLMSKFEGDVSVGFSKAQLSKITTTGELGDIERGMGKLIKTLRDLDRHRLEIEAFYQRELAIFSEYKSIKTSEDAVKVIKKLDDLKYPGFDLDSKDHSMSISALLPGGKVFAFDPEACKYQIKTEEVSGKDSEETYSKDDVKRLMRQLDDLDDIYGAVKKANENYIQYLEKFNTVVKDAFIYVDDLKGKISTSLITDLQSRLEGNSHVFAFYSGFLPKVMTYVDGYIDVMSSHLSKQFN